MTNQRTVQLHAPLKTIVATGNATVRTNVPQRQTPPPIDNQLLHSINDALREIEQRRSQSLYELQVAAVEIGMMATSVIVADAISKDQFPIEKVIERAIEKVEADATATIRLNPTDLQQFKTVDKETADSVMKGKTVQFKPDPRLQRGTCQIDLGDFGLLSSIDREIADLQRELLKGIDNARTERRQPEANNGGIRRFPDRRETA